MHRHASLSGSSRWVLLAFVCAFLVFFATLIGAQKGPAKPVVVNPVIVPRPLIRPAHVTGIIVLSAGESIAAAPAGTQIALPDVEVSLQRNSDNKTVATGMTQLDGAFHLKAPGSGTYSLCWKRDGLANGCGTKFVVTSAFVMLKYVPVRALPGVIRGKVLTRDDRPCWVHDPYFKLDVSTRVALIDTGGQAVQKVRANVSGEYVFGGVKSARYTVRADCEKATRNASVSLQASSASANLVLPNHAPRLEGIGASQGGQVVTRAAAGTLVQVDTAVRDADADPIEYLWRALDGSVPGTNAAQQGWQLAAHPGLHSLYLMARDGKGGYAFKRFGLLAGGGDVTFSGHVIDEGTQNPVGGAAVSVNGKTTTTNNAGWFRLAVAPAPSPERYVLNINHAQYAELSRIHDKEATGDTYELIRAQITTNHDPTKPIDVVDTSSGGPCGSRKPQATGAVTPTVSFKALRGRILRKAVKYDQRQDTKPCRHRGAHVVIPAGALVDSGNNPAKGPVTMSFATMNPARRSLPGDYRATDRTGRPVEMLSFGAMYAQFRDATDKPVNLKTGAPAEIRIPVSDEQRPSAQPTIPIWSYDDQSGLWQEEGQAALQNTAEGWMYVGETKHFSYLNMDVGGDDPDKATCVRFELGNSLAGWTNLRIRAYVSYAGQFVQVKETELNGDLYHAIFRIPYAPPQPPPNTLRLELRGTYSGTDVVLLDNVIATDAPRPKMTGNNLWPPLNYEPCGAVVTLEADPVNLPYYGVNDATGRPFFLTGPYGTFLPEDGEQAATDYYNTIDPADTFHTLQLWWNHHGFNDDGTGGTSAQYLNFNDLGFGRDMNCKVTGSDLACYVTNYGLPDQSDDNSAAAFAHDGNKRGATVAMEFKSSEPSDRRVRFYVYGGGDPAAATKLKFADLDGLGPKPVPHLCTVCHGGYYDEGPKNALLSRFREFDLQSFRYPGGLGWDYGQAPLAQFNSLALLNQMVRDVVPNTSPIKPLINAWYPGNNFTGAPALPTPPAGWSGQTNVYHNVYGKSCRTCHIARDYADANSSILFNTASDFETTSYVVCGTIKKMPNAYVTYKNFWSDIQRVIDYQNFTAAGPCQ